jgi:hypothetical protein
MAARAVVVDSPRAATVAVAIEVAVAVAVEVEVAVAVIPIPSLAEPRDMPGV